MSNELNMVNFDMELNLDEPIEKDESLFSELDLKLRDLYPTSTRVAEIGGIILVSKARKARLVISSNQIHFFLESESGCDEIIEKLIHEWNIIKSVVLFKGKANSIITGLFLYNSEKQPEITKVLKWQEESAKILGKGEVSVGAMISVGNMGSSNLISIIGTANSGSIQNVQYSKKSNIELIKLEQQLQVYCGEVKTKLLKILDKNFFE